jgi:uncharacterized membrane protein YgcG
MNERFSHTAWFMCDNSNVTNHTSHVTRHTSHVTRHTSHVTRHTSHVTRHTPITTWMGTIFLLCKSNSFWLLLLWLCTSESRWTTISSYLDTKWGNGGGGSSGGGGGGGGSGGGGGGDDDTHVFLQSSQNPGTMAFALASVGCSWLSV